MGDDGARVAGLIPKSQQSQEVGTGSHQGRARSIHAVQMLQRGARWNIIRSMSSIGS